MTSSAAREFEEPLTPTGRLFVRPEMDLEIHCALGFERPLEVEATKALIMDSFFLKHPRFRSLVLRDGSGIERWRETHVDFDRHVIIVDSPVSSSSDDDDAVNEYIADLTTGPGLSTDKPLWEIHFLMAHRCMVVRVHHALIDGVSLMSMLMSICRKVGDPEIPPKGRTRSPEKAMGIASFIYNSAKMVWLSLLFGLQSLMRIVCVRDRNTVISGGDGVEMWPRKIATARFLLEDMEVVKRAIPKATINDVLVGVVSSGLAKYLEERTPSGVPEGLQITGLAMVNLRKQPGLPDLSDLKKSNSKSRWGNKFGMILLPIEYHKNVINSNPLQYVTKAKAVLDRKKQSLEALISIKFTNCIMSYLGSKIACLVEYRYLCNTSFTISNIVGPPTKISIGDNPVRFMRVNISSLPHALILHMVSYAGKAELQVLVAKDIIPDPEFLAKCFENALLDMKQTVVK